jgi:hypothetical protein
LSYAEDIPNAKMQKAGVEESGFAEIPTRRRSGVLEGSGEAISTAHLPKRN